jgi:hypothetical protein
MDLLIVVLLVLLRGFDGFSCFNPSLKYALIPQELEIT